jgi:transposase InsO family protein
MSGEEEAPEDPDVDLLEEEEDVEEDMTESPSVKRAQAMNETWLKLAQEAENVTVRRLTFVCPVKSRSVKHILPAISRVHARLPALGLPVYRLHSDRAREFSSAKMQAWALGRNILTTMTAGSSFKANGRVEAEMGVIKKSIRTVISAGTCTLQHWPL